MLKQLVLPLLVLFVWSGCDSFHSEDKRDNQVVDNAELRHSNDNGEGSGDEGSGDEGSGEDTGEDTGGDTGGCNDDDAGDVPQCDEQAALAAFKTHVQPSIDKACNMCHAFAAGGLTMTKEEGDATVVTQNRVNLKASTQSASAEKLFLKISNQSSAGHGGGDQSDPDKGNLTLAKIEAWLAAEVGCD